jgi:alpha-galactosidase
MTHQEDSVRSVSSTKVLVLLGAGSAVFTRGLLADLISAPDLGRWDLRLVDVNEEALEVAVGLAQRMVKVCDRCDSISVSGSTDRRTVLPGADFVVSSVGIGGRPAWEADWQVVKRYGILQPVGDSVLPGGVSRAMRTIPVMVEIAEDVVRLAPDALFFNYSNPMTANCAAMISRAGAHVAGLCHGVWHVQRELARLIRKPAAETSTLYCGINHLTFIYDFRWRGEDAWPLTRQRVAEDFAAPADPDDLGNIWQDGSKATYNPFSWELFGRLGAYPAADDRHVTEFFPERWASGDYYGKTLGVDAFSLQEILEWGEERYQRMKREASASSAADGELFDASSGEQEQLLSILRSVLTDQRITVSANVPNRGLVPNLPTGAIVEIPAIVTARGLRGLEVPDFADPLAAIVTRRLAPIEVMIDAALSGDPGLFAEAIILDGAVSDRVTADAMVRGFIAAQQEFLPRFA